MTQATFLRVHNNKDLSISICVLAQSVERPPHNREVVGSIPGRVIPKDVKRWELLLPCLAFNI